jgi:phosphoglycerol transferase MdoB-like AlkP superfamily enzyme
MAAGRLILVSVFALPGELEGRWQEIWAMWGLGIRYDFRAAIVGLVPIYLLGLASCFYGGATQVCSWLQKIYSPFLYLAFSLATVANHFYYRTFQKELDVMAFGLKDDDTAAVLSSMVSDYPFFRTMLLVLVVTVSFAWLTRYLWRVLPNIFKGVASPAIKVASLVAFTIVSFMGARGTLLTIPLRQRDRTVSKVPILNNAIPNAVIALDWAWSNYKNVPPYLPVTIEEGAELAMKSLGRGELTESTPDNPYLAKNQPHVVLVVMEGLGSNLLEFDRPGAVDLLGSFRPHMENDFVFRRFLAEDYRTVAALMRILFYCPDMNVTQSLFKSVKIDDSAFDVYKKNGYETVFLHTGLPSWWNMQPYMSVQGVDRTFFSNEFRERYKDTKLDITAGSWGLPDEYIYPLTLELLEKSSKPMFIVIMTLSNHSPFNIPPSYKDRFPIAIDTELLSNFFESKETVGKLLSSYQYANNCIGDFIAAIKGGPLGSRTVVGVTGDHVSAKIKAEHHNGLFLNKAAPFYLYAPKPKLERTKHLYAPERAGSHKDIMPTLYSMSLSGAQYYTVGGRDMLAEKDDPFRAFGYNTRLFMDANGACGIGAEFSNSWHKWGGGWALKPETEAIPEPASEKMQNYEKLYRWQINKRIGGTVK